LVRSAVVEALALRPSRESVQALLNATGDDYKLVRTRAAAALAGYSAGQLANDVKTKIEKANQEYLTSIMARPDQWTSHYNMGNYHLNRGDFKEAIASYQAAQRLESQAIMALVNSSIVYAQMGENDKAEKSLQEALNIAPDNAAANFNMGLLKAAKNELRPAENFLKKALKSDPQMAKAAYNLCVITAKDRVKEAVRWCKESVKLNPQDPKYQYTLAFYLYQKGDKNEAIRILKAMTEKYPGYQDAKMLYEELSSQKND
jgi:tetratricopeptide (TPR) repeat protein